MYILCRYVCPDVCDLTWNKYGYEKGDKRFGYLKQPVLKKGVRRQDTLHREKRFREEDIQHTFSYGL